MQNQNVNIKKQFFIDMIYADSGLGVDTRKKALCISLETSTFNFCYDAAKRFGSPVAREMICDPFNVITSLFVCYNWD